MRRLGCCAACAQQSNTQFAFLSPSTKRGSLHELETGHSGSWLWAFLCLMLEFLVLFVLGCTHNWGSVVGGFILALPFVDDERFSSYCKRKKTRDDATQEQNEGRAGGAFADGSMEAEEHC